MKRSIIRLLTIIPTLVIALAGSFFTTNIDIRVNVGTSIIIIMGIIWAIVIVIDERNEKITNTTNELQKLNDKFKTVNEKLEMANSQIAEFEEKSDDTIHVNEFCLKHRSTTVISDFIKETENEIYITGIINNGAITTFINDKEIFETCCKKGIIVRILFYVSDNEEYLKWYLGMMCREHALEERINIDKGNYRSCINEIDHRDVFRELKKRDLLETRRLDIPGTTAFVASDINCSNSGKIQCQFYQYKTESRDCPVCQLNSSDEMFSEMRDIILDMWESATPNTSVDYIENITIRADKRK